jgi:signal transduction histidine kinase
MPRRRGHPTRVALGHWWLFQRRGLLVYFLAIVVPTVVFVFLGLQSVQRQRQAIRNLTASNLRLSAESLAAELERQTGQLAEACLRDGEWSGRQPAFGAATSLTAARDARILLEKIRNRHPIARHFFLIQGSTVAFPVLRTPPAQRAEAALAQGNRDLARRFARLITEGENQELTQQRPDLALATYRQGFDLPVPGAGKALALSRMARCLQKVKQPKAAEQAYYTLAERYGDLYDSFHRPYALVAGLQLDSRALQLRFAQDLVRGRWELSAEQFDYFLGRMEERLGQLPAEAGQNDYCRHFRLGQALEQRFRHQGPLRGGETYAYAFAHDQANYQIYYTRRPSEAGQETVAGLAVDLDWVEHRLLPKCRAASGVQTGLVAGLRPASEAEPPGTLATRVPFKAVFPFWRLSLGLAAGQAGQTAGRRDLLIFGASTALVLTVLLVGVVLLLRDVSREMQLSRVRADFVSGVSHELKTPLTLIRLYGETLLDSDDMVREKRRSYYQVITRESERLTQLIEKVLDFSRIDRGRKQYHLEKGDLAAVVRRTVEVYEHYLRRRGFSVETELAPSLPPVRFDAEAVAQAVLNLLDNAMKYSGESRFVAVRSRSEDNRVVLEVQDHGIGIPADEHDKIFQQFYRAHGGTGETGKGGYGLGLFLVKHIMDAHGGSIELDSESGRGSCFRLIFPAMSAGTERAAAAG